MSGGWTESQACMDGIHPASQGYPEFPQRVFRWCYSPFELLDFFSLHSVLASFLVTLHFISCCCLNHALDTTL